MGKQKKGLRGFYDLSRSSELSGDPSLRTAVWPFALSLLYMCLFLTSQHLLFLLVPLVGAPTLAVSPHQIS